MTPRPIAARLPAFLLALTLCGVLASAENLPVLTPSTPLRDVTFVVFDTETTGLNPNAGRVLEIGAVKLRNRQVIDRKCWLINPGIPISEEAQRINGITAAMVSNCPPFNAVFREFAAFTEGSVLLAHNASFDRRFIAAELARNGQPSPENPLLDTLPLYRRWFPGLRSYALESLTHAVIPGLEEAAAPAAGNGAATGRTNRFHSALWDAECTAALFMKGLANLPDTATLAALTQITPKVPAFKSPPPSKAPEGP